MSQKKAAAPEPMEIAGRYQVVQKLGAGAFGTVYKAKDRVLGRMVAIKTIRLEGLAAAGASLDELMDRFKREAQVSAQLKHPNIVTIYDIGDSDGLSYLAMEFIDGVGLDRVIANAGRLPVERAASMAAQVADALDFAHRNNVVHRDIKPANIMIEPGDRVKVTDFGIAKVTDSGDHLTVTGSLLGTPSYMSPEQAKGSELDGRSDLFAVGCVLYEMLVGRKAFRGESITGLIFKIITEEPTPIREVDPNVPEALAAIITRALSKSPDARYQTGRELADDLLALTRPGNVPTLRQVESPTQPVPAPAPTMVSPPTTAPPPPTVAAAARTAVRAPRPPAPSPPPPLPAPARAAAPPPRPPARPDARKHSSAGLLIAFGLVGLLVFAFVGAAGWYLLRRDVGPQTATATPAPTAAPESTAAETAEPTPEPAPTAVAAEASAEPVAMSSAAPATLGQSAQRPPARPPGETATPQRSAREPATRGPEVPGAADPPAASGDFSFLDQEAAPVDGREAGERLAESFRNRQGPGSGGGFGASQRYARRERSPRGLMPRERPAVATLRHVMNAEEAFYKREGRYGTLSELAGARLLFLDVRHSAQDFQRAGYRFQLTVTGDGFRVVSMPVAGGLRPFQGDDSGFIQTGLD